MKFYCALKLYRTSWIQASRIASSSLGRTGNHLDYIFWEFQNKMDTILIVCFWLIGWSFFVDTCTKLLYMYFRVCLYHFIQVEEFLLSNFTYSIFSFWSDRYNDLLATFTRYSLGGLLWLTSLDELLKFPVSFTQFHHMNLFCQI